MHFSKMLFTAASALALAQAATIPACDAPSQQVCCAAYVTSENPLAGVVNLLLGIVLGPTTGGVGILCSQPRKHTLKSSMLVSLLTVHPVTRGCTTNPLCCQALITGVCSFHFIRMIFSLSIPNITGAVTRTWTRCHWLQTRYRYLNSVPAANW